MCQENGLLSRKDLEEVASIAQENQGQSSALAVTAAVLYVMFAIMDVVSLWPNVGSSVASLVMFVIVVGGSWAVGYAWAWLYNRFAKRF